MRWKSVAGKCDRKRPLSRTSRFHARTHYRPSRQAEHKSEQSQQPHSIKGDAFWKILRVTRNGLHKNGRPPFDHVFRQPCVMGMPPVVCIAQLRPRIGGIAGVNAVQRLIEPKTVRGSCVQRGSELRLGIRDLRIFCRTEKLLRIDPKLRMPLPFT